MSALSHGLGVSTFPWGRVTDTREKELPLAILRPKDRGLASYSGLGEPARKRKKVAEQGQAKTDRTDQKGAKKLSLEFVYERREAGKCCHCNDQQGMGTMLMIPLVGVERGH
ncbi:hypothetical protein CDL15_Pgr000998 [Punica granatum]|uniref:Uncharacterized protein n=1 Tax=Punica granatum TaxID=22663 RepID=A0A218XIC0_PUNGR|nr:hypothetical protein CDL15_Pgr000998 [Punica granatum]